MSFRQSHLKQQLQASLRIALQPIAVSEAKKALTMSSCRFNEKMPSYWAF
jgi:hypothetical protein